MSHFRGCDLAFYVRHFHDHGVPHAGGILPPRHPLWAPRLRDTLWAMVAAPPEEREGFDRAFDQAFEEVMAPYRVPVVEWVRHLRGEGLDEGAIRARLQHEGYPRDVGEARLLDALLETELNPNRDISR